jgi:endogenous inhibitor of DNA gyrase (YacG/DUF329 family)
MTGYDGDGFCSDRCEQEFEEREWQVDREAIAMADQESEAFDLWRADQMEDKHGEPR